MLHPQCPCSNRSQPPPHPQIDTVATTLALAEQNNARELKRVCLEFVSKHLQAVMASEGYQYMVQVRCWGGGFGWGQSRGLACVLACGMLCPAAQCCPLPAACLAQSSCQDCSPSSPPPFPQHSADVPAAAGRAAAGHCHRAARPQPRGAHCAAPPDRGPGAGGRREQHRRPAAPRATAQRVETESWRHCAGRP